MKQPLSLVLLVSLLTSLTSSQRAFAAPADDESPEKAAWDQMVSLNKKAFTAIQGRKFSAAKDALLEALVVGNDAGLDNSEMMARTYVHLAAVYVTGEKDRDKGVNQFMLALKIKPTITMTSQLDTPALKSAYLLARRQLGLSPGAEGKATAATSPEPPAPAKPAEPAPVASAPEPTIPAPPVSAPPADGKTTMVSKRGRGGHKVEVTLAEPDVPARVPAPLYCPLPFEIPPGEDLIVRCLTQRQQKKSTATLFYRAEAAKGDAFFSAAMVRTSKGWLQTTVPGDVIKGKSLSYYVEAHIPGSSDTMSLGRPDAPNAFLIKEGADASNLSEKENILDSLNVKIAEENDSGLYHRREVGAIWMSLAGGSGAAYHGKEALDSGATDPQGNVVRSLSGITPAGQVQAEIELGYQLNKDLSLSAMGRYQHASAESLGYSSRPILTAAKAAYLRARYTLLTKGNLQGYGSAGLGGGNNFLVIINKQCDGTQPGCRLPHSDTLHGGPMGLLLGVGAIYHLSRNVGVFVDVNEILTLPKFMALTEINIGLAVAYKRPKNATTSDDGIVEKAPDGDEQN